LQARQATQLVLLNDCILVASRKKRTMSSKVKLVADRCWQLDKILVADVKNTPDLTNALKIVHYNDEYLFRCERPEDKMSLLVTVKRVTDELMESSKQNDADAKLSVNGKDIVPMQGKEVEFLLIMIVH
jgi:exocyst complex component 8